MSDIPKDALYIELILMKSEFVLFDAKFTHFGGRYEDAPGNLRGHIYLLSPVCGLGTIDDTDGEGQPLTEARPFRGGKISDGKKVFLEKSCDEREKTKKRKFQQRANGTLLGKRRAKQQ
jgi:hypothetical protein